MGGEKETFRWRGLPRVGSSIPARPRPTKDGRPYLQAKDPTFISQWETGDREVCCGLGRDDRPVVRGRAGRAPTNHPVPGLPLSIASPRGRDASAYASVLNPRSRHRRAPTFAAASQPASVPVDPHFSAGSAVRYNGVSSTNPTRILPLGSRVKCIIRCGPSVAGFTTI